MLSSGLIQDEKLKAIFDSGFAKRRWLSLVRQFKFYFYASLKPKTNVNFEEFPYFKKMSKMFADYAIEQLSINCDENETIDTTSEGVTRYLVKLLEGDQTLSGCENIELSDNESVEGSEDFMKKFMSIPKESRNIFTTKLQVVQSTPFNRNFQRQTLYKRASLLNSFKIEKKEKPSINNTKDDSQDWEIEALDDTDTFTIIPNENSPIIHSMTLCNDSIELKKNVNKKTSEFISSTMKEDENSQKSVEFESILEVPSMLNSNVSIERLRCQENSKSNNQQFNIPTTMNRKRFSETSTPIEIIPKRLKFTNESFEKQKTKKDQENEAPAPRWFQQFLFRYNEDMMRIDNQMQSINKRLTNIEKKLYN